MKGKLAYLWGSTTNGQKPSLAFIRFPALVLLPSTVLLSALVALFLPPAVALSTIEGIILSALGLSIIRTIIALSISQAKGPTEIQLHPIHSQFKVSLVAYGFLAVMGFTALVISLSLLLPGYGVLFPSVEIGLLAITIAFLALFARYNAMSLSVEMTRLQEESRSSAKNLGDNFITATKELTETYNKNTSDLISNLESQSERQARLLAGMADALHDIAKSVKAQLEVVAESKELAQKTLENQKETERERRELEERRQLAEQQAQEVERLRMLPVIGVRLSAEGLVFHHVHVDVVNTGMTARNVDVTLEASNGRSSTLLGGDLISQQLRRLDFGDVAGFPNNTVLTVRCGFMDASGRKYSFSTRFDYIRTLGWFNSTASISIQPNDYVFPTPLLQEHFPNALGFNP